MEFSQVESSDNYELVISVVIIKYHCQREDAPYSCKFDFDGFWNNSFEIWLVLKVFLKKKR